LLLIPLFFLLRGRDKDDDVQPVVTDTAAVVPATTPMQTDTASPGVTPPTTTDTTVTTGAGATGTATDSANPADTLVKVDSTRTQ